MTQRTRHRRTKVLAFKREGRLYIATSCFIPRYIVNNVFNKFFCNRFQLKLFLKENFCFNLKMLRLDQFFFIIASISSKFSNFSSSGYSSKSRFLVVRMKIIFKAFATWGLSSKVFLFSIRRISASFFACLLEKYGMKVDENGLELFFVSRLEKKIVFTTLLQFINLICCFL